MEKGDNGAMAGWTVDVLHRKMFGENAFAPDDWLFLPRSVETTPRWRSASTDAYLQPAVPPILPQPFMVVCVLLRE